VTIERKIEVEAGSQQEAAFKALEVERQTEAKLNVYELPPPPEKKWTPDEELLK
jgi:hypothetical protein